MQRYSYILDLQIKHPTLDPDLVSRTLGLEPKRSWRVGESRKTPKGTLLEGVHSEGYWSANPFLYGWRESTDAQIEDAVEELVTFLEPHRDFLMGISQGGVIRVWVSSQSIRNYAFELSPKMLARLSSLGATFVHDVYQGS